MCRKFLTIILVLFVACCSSAIMADETTAGDTAISSPIQDNSQRLLLQAVNGLGSYYANYMKNLGEGWVANTDFNLSATNFDSWNDLQARITTLQPFSSKFSFDDRHFSFWQLSAGYQNSSFTGNLGVGYRVLNDSKSQMYGVNLFYDAGWLNNSFVAPAGYANYKASESTPVHQRIGMGLEYFWNLFELRANGYYAFSDAQLLGTATQTVGTTMNSFNFYEKAANGFDLSASSQLPFLPWLKANVAGYRYFADSNQTAYRGNLNGWYIGGSAQLTPGLRIDGGYDTGGKNGYVAANYNMLALPQPSLLWSDDTINAYSQYNVSNKYLNKVQRDNNITTVSYVQQNRSVNTRGSITAVVQDYNGVPQPNVVVALYSSSMTIQTKSTGADGKVAFTNLPWLNNFTPGSESISYVMLTDVKEYDFAPGGSWQNREIVNTIYLDRSAVEVTNTCQSQPPANGGTAPIPTPVAPPLTTVKVLIENNNPNLVFDMSPGSITCSAFSISSGSGVEVSNSNKTNITPTSFFITACNGLIPTDANAVNYGSGQYAVQVHMNSTLPGQPNRFVGATANISINGAGNSDPYNVNNPDIQTVRITIPAENLYIQSMTVNFTNRAGQTADTVLDTEGQPRQVYIAAATSVNAQDPSSNPHLPVTGGTVVWQGGPPPGGSLPWNSEQLAIVAYYIDAHDPSRYHIIGGDMTVTVPDAARSYVVNVRQFPFDIN